MLGLSEVTWKDKKEEEEHQLQQQQLAYPSDNLKYAA